MIVRSIFLLLCCVSFVGSACVTKDPTRIPTDVDPPGPESFSVTDALRRIEQLADSRKGALEVGSFLSHPESAVKQAAARGLGLIGDPDSVSILLPYLAKDDAGLRREIAFALYQLPQWYVADQGLHELKRGEAAQALIEALAVEEDEATLAEMLRALASLGGAEAKGALRERLSFSGSAPVTAAAVLQLGLWSRGSQGHELSAEDLQSLLALLAPWQVQEGGEQVRHALLYALARGSWNAEAKLGIQAAFAELFGRGTPTEGAWLATAWSKSAQQDPSEPMPVAAPIDAEWLASASTPERTAWARALVHAHHIDAWEMISGLLQDPDPLTAQAAAESLGDGSGLLEEEAPLHMAALLKALASELPEVRCAALSQAGVIGMESLGESWPSAEPELQLQHANLTTVELRRCVAAGANSFLRLPPGAGTKQALRLALALADDPDTGVRLNALEALTADVLVGNEPARLRLAKAASGVDAQELELAGLLLVEREDVLPTARIDELLASLPSDPALGSGRAALIGVLEGRKAGDGALLQALMLQDPDWFVRKAAADALGAFAETTPFSFPARSESEPGPLVEELPTHLVVDSDRGQFSLRMRSDLAPRTVQRMSSLAASGYFDGTMLHRVVPGFVVQGGDPTGSGWGGPPDRPAMRCELSSAPYKTGTVGMALAGRDTGGSQFFIALDDFPHLDGRYTVWADVDEGMDVVRTLRRGDKLLRVRPSP